MSAKQVGKQVGKQVIRLVTPRPQFGLVGVVGPLAVGGGILVGTYIMITRLLPGATDGTVIGDIMDAIAAGVKNVIKKVNPLYPSWETTATALNLPEPDPVFGQWGNAANEIANIFVPGIYIAVTSFRETIGGSFGIAASKLKPNTRFIYGWKPLGSWPGYTQEFTADAKGYWFGPGPVIIDLTTPPGNHKIYIDQRTFGGKYAEINFEVLAGAGF